MITINLPSTQNITISPAVVVPITQYNIIEFKDNLVDSVTAIITLGADVSVLNRNRLHLTLWDANTTPNYQTIGDWTQEEALARVATLINS